MHAEAFRNDEAGYFAWLLRHPDGLVLNRRKGASAGYLVLHRASCGRIRQHTATARPGGFTERGYIKVCAVTEPDLRQYAAAEGGRPDGSFSARCRSCSP